MQRLRNLKSACFSHTGKIYHAKRNGNNISSQHTDQNGGKLPDSLAKMVQCCYHSESKKCDQPVLPGTIIRIGGTASHVINSSGIQGKSDSKYHRSCDQRWEKYPDLLHQDSHNDRHNTTYDLCSHNGINSVTICNSLHTWHISKAYTHDHRKAGSDFVLLPDREQLDQSRQRSDHKSCLNQNNLIRILKPRCPRYYNSRCDTSHDHGHYMLQCQRKSFLKSWDSICFKNTASFHNDFPLSFIFYQYIR